MSATLVKLEKITSASNEAYFSWEIDESISFKKGMLCLTDIDQDADPDSAIYKYQLHSTESPAGAHIFEDLHVGQYYAQLTIIGTDDSINVSALLTETVYELGAAKIASVSARDSGFVITLDPYDGVLQSGQSINTVSFVLFGRKRNASGLLATGRLTTQHLNIVKDYRSDNIYELLDSEYKIQNSWQYEIACFYTDNQNISGDISNTKVETPSNLPNQIKDVVAEYDYSNKRLIIKYTNPDDISEWTPKTVRATLTYGSIVQTYPFSASSNSGTVYRGQQLVFDASSSPLLTPDTSFTLTLAMESVDFLGYSPESDAITCIVPSKFCSEPTTLSNVQYIVGDNEFKVTYDQTNRNRYNVSVRMVITYYDSTESVYENDNYVSGTPVYDVVNGEYYKVNLQVFYNASIDTSIEFGPSSQQTTYFDKTFIPHGQADAPSNLRVVYGDGTATLSWDEPEFYGYILDRYELSNNNGATWSINTSSNKSYLASCDDGYISGNTYNFKVRAVTKSPNASVYNGVERADGQTSSIDVYPLKKPEPPIIDSHFPGDTICDVTFHDGNIYNGVKQHYKYTISNAPSGQIPSNNTSYTFIGLINNVALTIGISIVTKSGPDNVQESDQVTFDTTPFKMPVTPTLSAKPYTSCVVLTWSPNNPDTILGQPVEYDVAYKLSSDTQWNTSKTSVTSPLTIHGLTPNAEYNFKIRSKIYNLENDETLRSDYSTPITSRPFKYKNAPTMNLVAGNGTITVTITPPVSPNNNYYDPHAYHATVDTDPDVQGSGIILEQTSNTATLIFNVGNSGLVNLSKYKVVAWYDMVIDEQYVTTTDPYESNPVSNSATPFDPDVAPPLFSDPDNGQITFTWNDANMNGLTITGYQVSSKYTSSTWGAWETLTLAECNQEAGTTQNVNDYYIVRNHPNGTKMSYKIRAVILNAGNTYYSADSLEAVATPYTLADAPTLASYVSSSGQITLNWAQPSNLGGLPLERYEVSKDSGDSWTSNNSSTTYHFNTGLTNGTLYTFKVRAVTDNSDNMAQDSNLDTVLNIISSNVLSQNARPYAVPTISLNSVVSGDNQLTLNWTQSLGGHPFDYYFIYKDGISWAFTNSSDLEFILRNLNNGTQYDCAVEIYVKDENDNAAFPVFSTRSLSKINIPYKPAVAPINVTSVPSNGSVRVSWNNLTTSELGGLSLKRYEVKKDNELNWIQSSSSLYHDFTGLNNGTEYTFKVRAVTTNSNYASDPAITTDEVIGAAYTIYNIPYLPLGGPLELTCLPGDKTVSLYWSEPPLVGLSLDHYEVSGGVLTAPVNVGTSIQYPFTDLSNNTPYSFYVRAVATHTYAGTITGPDSEISKIPFAIPKPITTLTCTAVNGDLTVYFEDPSTSDVNNGLARDYKIKLLYTGYNLDNIDYNDVINGDIINISTTSTETIGVYVYSRIRDPNNNNSNTNSVYSPYKNINVVNSNLQSDIQNLTATVGDKQITLNWENINADSGSTYAIVRIKDDGSFERLPNVYTETAVITTLSDGSPLVNGTLYRFNVYASQDDMLQITATPIGKPIINSVSNSGSNFTVNVNFAGDTKVYITILGVNSDNILEIMGPKTFYTTVNTISGESSSYLKYVVIVSNSVGSVNYQSA